MQHNPNPWLTRIFAGIIMIVVWGGFLEGAAYTLVIFVSAAAIFVWTFMPGKQGSTKK